MGIPDDPMRIPILYFYIHIQYKKLVNTQTNQSQEAEQKDFKVFLFKRSIGKFLSSASFGLHRLVRMVMVLRVVLIRASM